MTAEDAEVVREALELAQWNIDGESFHKPDCDLNWGSCSCEKAPWDALSRILQDRADMHQALEIAQAEARQAVAENERLREGAPVCCHLPEEQEVERLREALAFYADPDNYHYQPFIDGDGERSVRAFTKADDDGGTIARQALSPTEEVK